MHLRFVMANLIAGAVLLSVFCPLTYASSPPLTASSPTSPASRQSSDASPQDLERKDVLSLSLGGVAFVLSLVATVVSLRQKKYETERTLRSQLTDAIGKLNSTYESLVRLRGEQASKWNDSSNVAQRSFYNGQKMFYARQAIYVAKQIPKLVTDSEYSSIARAFSDADDDKSAFLYYEKAIAAAHDSYYRAINIRGYARLLIRANRVAEGRKKFEHALSLVGGGTDSEKWFRAETLQRWGEVEALRGDQASSECLFERASGEFSTISFAPRRKEGLQNLSGLRSSLAGTAEKVPVTSLSGDSLNPDVP